MNVDIDLDPWHKLIEANYYNDRKQNLIIAFFWEIVLTRRHK